MIRNFTTSPSTLVGTAGFEPASFRLRGEDNQPLYYVPTLVYLARVELATGLL